MRFDVLNLILGWTLVALTVPLLFCVGAKKRFLGLPVREVLKNVFASFDVDQ